MSKRLFDLIDNLFECMDKVVATYPSEYTRQAPVQQMRDNLAAARIEWIRESIRYGNEIDTLEEKVRKLESDVAALMAGPIRIDFEGQREPDPTQLIQPPGLWRRHRGHQG